MRLFLILLFTLISNAVMAQSGTTKSGRRRHGKRGLPHNRRSVTGGLGDFRTYALG